MDMSKLYAKNDSPAGGSTGGRPFSGSITKSPATGTAARNIKDVSEEELDKAFNKPIVSEKLHLKEQFSGNMPLEAAMSSVNKKSLIMKLVGAVAVIVILAFIGLIASDNLYLVTGNLPENPVKAMEIVMNRMQEAKSMHMEGTMTIDLDIASDIKGAASNQKIKYNISGDTEFPDKNHFVISVVSSTVPQISKEDTEIITIGKKEYFRLKSAAGDDKNSEEWIDMDSVNSGKAVTPSFDTSMISSKYLKYIKEVKLADKDSNNSHYKITLDGDKILASEEFEQLKKIYNNNLSEVEIVEDIWVDSKNKLINKNTAEISMVTKEGESGAGDGSGTVKVKNSISLEFSDFGKEVSIKAPDNAKKLSGLAVEEFGLSGNDQKRATDLVIVTNAMQKYYTDNKKYPSTDMKLQKLNSENILKTELISKYLPSLPQDPNDPKAFYGYKSDGSTYELTAVLEDQNASVCKMNGNLCIFMIKNGNVASRK